MAETTDLEVEHKRLHEKVRQSLDDGRKSQAQLAKLEDQMEDLMLSIASANDTASTALIEYAKIDCRKLCNTIYRTLPREIRDMIYGYIHPGSTMKVFSHSKDGEWGNDIKPSYFRFDSEAGWRLDCLSHPRDHLWTADSLGDDIFPELLEQYFRATHFEFGDQYDLIPRFQFTDQWGLGTTPADYVTNVKVSIICKDGKDYSISVPDRGSCSRRNSGCRCWDRPEEDHTWCRTEPPPMPPRVKILTQLQTLFGFKPGTRISIKIGTRFLFASPLEELELVRDTIIPIIFSTLQRLHQSGYLVDIVLCGGVPPDYFWYYLYAVDGDISTLQACKEKFKEFEDTEISKEEENKERLKKLKEKEDAARVEDEDSGDEDDGGDGVWGFITSADGHPDNNTGGWSTAGG